MPELNAEQQTLFDKVVSLSFSKLLLLGDAGSGKTFALCKAVSQLVRDGQTGVVLCAPTHLARLNILNKLDPDIVHIAETATVASLLMKFGIDSEDGTVQFTAGKLDKIDKYKVVALDECSMLSEQDYVILMQSKAKIIFLGDFSQLPPVMARSSETKMNSHTGTGNLEVVRLVQQMRQQGVIHAAAERNRKAVWFPENNEVGEGGEAITVHDTERDMVDRMVAELLADNRGYLATYHHRYIAYRNVSVREVGKRIRDRVLGNYFGFNTESVPFIYSELIMMRENRGSIGYNGEIVEVKSVRKDPKFKTVNPYPWESYELTVKGSLGTGMIRTIPPCAQKSMDEYMSGLQSRLKRAQIAGDFVTAKDVLSQIKKTRSYWTITQYPYAVTTHKSQGMTIENVYLNTSSFVSAPNKRALLYVGISRASRNLHTVKVTGNDRFDRAAVNSRYRAARAAYTDVSGESYRKVLGYLGVSTRDLQGKEIVTEYLEALVDDMRQGE